MAAATAREASATLAFVGTVISETVASTRGIGNLMTIAAYVVFSAIERRLAGWAVRWDDFGAAA